MADIKCEYRRWRCTNCTPKHQRGSICEHHGFYGEYDQSCEDGDCEPYKVKDGVFHVPINCRYVTEETVMFEKDVKSWKLENYEFTMKKLSVHVGNIKELVIDGKIIIVEGRRCGWIKGVSRC